MGVFRKHAPLKYKYVRANQIPYMSKGLWKAVMLRSQLRNKDIKEIITVTLIHHALLIIRNFGKALNIYFLIRLSQLKV